MQNKVSVIPIATLIGAEVLWAALTGEGVTAVFGYPGGATLPTYAARNPKHETTESFQ